MRGGGGGGEQGEDMGLSHLKSPGNDIPVSNFKSYLQIILNDSRKLEFMPETTLILQIPKCK